MSRVEIVTRPRFQLLAYQKRWVEDNAKLKIAVKARQIGFSFAATLRAVLKCLEGKTTWILLSKGERQSRLLMEKVREHVQACGAVARWQESEFFEGTSARQLEARFPNGSVITALPANPETARGYSGNVTLDEFAFHADAGKIYTALFPSITRGYSMEVISTPNGTQGKFYELARAAGLAEEGGAARGEGEGGVWSGHWCDVYEAVRQGLRLDLAALRAGCDDETTWLQEYNCVFVSSAENFFSPELVARCLSAEATTDYPLERLIEECRETKRTTEFYLGVDVGRRHDRTVFWLDEARAEETSERHGSSDAGPRGVAVTRLVRTLERTPFAEQLEVARQLLAARRPDGRPLIQRAAVDATGLGAMLAETLEQEFAPRVEAVNFTAALKEELAFRTRRRMESGATRLPEERSIERAFRAVKKTVTLSGQARFDAARTEAGHADEFWAKALADYAHDARPRGRLSEGWLVGEALVDPKVFMETARGWAGMM